MNRSYITAFFTCLIINTTLYTSEQKSIVSASGLPSWGPIYKTLKRDYETYLQNRLEEYKKTDTEITTINMDELVSMSTLITGGNCAHKIPTIVDKDGNTFMHVAVEKADLPTVLWMCNDPLFKGTPGNKKQETAFDLCIKKLTPCSVDQQKDSVTHKILYALIERTGKVCCSIAPYKTVCLRQIAAVQLAYKKAGHELALTPELLRFLISGEKLEEEQSFLSTVYRDISDDDGNTFTHVLVEKELPDELFAWIKQDRVSFAQNNAGKSALDTALANFRFFTQNVMLIDQDKASFTRKKCCVFMLLNYLKIKSGQPANASFEHCCSSHTITSVL